MSRYQPINSDSDSDIEQGPEIKTEEKAPVHICEPAFHSSLQALTNQAFQVQAQYPVQDRFPETAQYRNIRAGLRANFSAAANGILPNDILGIIAEYYFSQADLYSALPEELQLPNKKIKEDDNRLVGCRILCAEPRFSIILDLMKQITEQREQKQEANCKACESTLTIVQQPFFEDLAKIAYDATEIIGTKMQDAAALSLEQKNQPDEKPYGRLERNSTQRRDQNHMCFILGVGSFLLAIVTIILLAQSEQGFSSAEVGAIAALFVISLGVCTYSCRNINRLNLDSFSIGRRYALSFFRPRQAPVDPIGLIEVVTDSGDEKIHGLDEDEKGGDDQLRSFSSAA
ncbi:MAG: hypothetical protein K0U12_02180 [Gammaproteobacteria bacterium]|nr:hypothetical protein [Gammaproteobacteria bacterium]